MGVMDWFAALGFFYAFPLSDFTNLKFVAKQALQFEFVY